MATGGGAPKKQKYDFAIRSTDLGAPTLVDRIGVELLRHLCVCQTCFATFAAQQESLETAGCVDGMRIVSHSRVAWEERRSKLASSHIHEAVLDDYLFGRLTNEEEDALVHHTAQCLPCARAIVNQESLIACIKSVLNKRSRAADRKTELLGAVSVRLSSHSFSVASPLLAQRAPIAVVVHRSNPLLNMTRSQLRFAFLRLIQHWPWGEEMMPVDLPEASEVRADFSRKWLKLEFAESRLTGPARKSGAGSNGLWSCLGPRRQNCGSRCTRARLVMCSRRRWMKWCGNFR